MKKLLAIFFLFGMIVSFFAHATGTLVFPATAPQSGEQPGFQLRWGVYPYSTYGFDGLGSIPGYRGSTEISACFGDGSSVCYSTGGQFAWSVTLQRCYNVTTTGSCSSVAAIPTPIPVCPSGYHDNYANSGDKCSIDASVCPVNSTGTFPSACVCDGAYTPDVSQTSCVAPPSCPAHASGTPCVCETGYTFNSAQTECLPTTCPHKYLGVETSSGYGFTSGVYPSSYVGCDTYNCAVHHALVAAVLGISLYKMSALNYACDSDTSLPSSPIAVTLAPSDPTVNDFVNNGTIPLPMTVTCVPPLVSNAAGNSCTYPDQSPGPALTCVAPMILNATGTACIDTTPVIPPPGSSGDPVPGDPPPAPTCPIGTTMTGGICVPNAAPGPGTSGNPTNVTGTVNVQFPSDYARTGEAAAAAVGLGTKLDTLHGDLTSQTTVADPTALTAADMPGIGTTFDGIKGWTLPMSTVSDLDGVLM